MRGDLFSRIFKYKSTQNISPLENYCTEIFVFILQNLIDKKDILSIEIFHLFGIVIENKEELKDIEISTQSHYYVKDRLVIPDIEIVYKGSKIFIEVKVNSSLREYSMEETSIDQLELYKNICNDGSVYCLTKNIIFSNSVKKDNKVLWTQIFEILGKSNDEIIVNFLNFSKEYGMKNYPIGKGADNAIVQLFNLMNLINNTWENDKYDLKQEICEEYAGFYIQKDKIHFAWIGQLRELREYIVFEILNDTILEKLSQSERDSLEADSFGARIIGKIKINELTCIDIESKQREILGTWIKNISDKLL